MADVEINDLPSKTTPVSTDEVEIQETSGGTSYKATLGNLAQGFSVENFSDVTITSIAAGELLKWDGAAWINNTLAEAGISATGHTHTESDITDLQSYLLNITGEPLSDLSDVTITTIASGELLKWNGSAWVNNTLSEAGVSATGHTHTESDITDLGSYITDISGSPLSELSDTTITAIASGELLKWDGAAWVNNTLAEAGISAVGHSHATSDITSGTFADARIAESNVTQHQAALSITESQISDLGTYPDITSGAGAPASTPTKVGDIYIDTTGDDAYIAVGTASSADWEKSNDGTGAGGLTDVVDDTTPQLGGSLDVNGNKIVSTLNGNIDIEPNGTGDVLLGNMVFDADQSIGAGQDDYVLTYDNVSGKISLEANTGGGGGIGGSTGSTDNAVIVADGVGGSTVQSIASVTVSDGGDVILVTPDSRVTAPVGDFNSLELSSGTVVSTVLDEDTMSSDSDTALATQQSIKAYVDAQITAAKSALYPVGVIYTNITGTNPATELGFGTWTAFGAGRVPVGYDSGDTDFDTAEETGGSKTHTLTVDEMPSHSHTTSSSQSAGVRVISGYAEIGTHANRGTVNNASSNPSTGSSGGGSAHTIVQPYIVVHMWKRTA